MHTWMCAMNNCVVSYRPLQCHLDFQHCNIVYNLSWRRSCRRWWKLSKQSASGEVEVLDLTATQFAAAYLMPVWCLLEFFWSPTNLLIPARRVYVSAGLEGWIALWVVLMNSRVNTREGKDWKKGGSSPCRGSELVDRLRASHRAVPCEGLLRRKARYMQRKFWFL